MAWLRQEVRRFGTNYAPENDGLAVDVALLHHPEVRPVLDASTCNIQVECARVDGVQSVVRPLDLNLLRLCLLLCCRICSTAAFLYKHDLSYHLNKLQFLLAADKYWNSAGATDPNMPKISC